MTELPLADFIEQVARRTDRALDACLPAARVTPVRLHEAMRYVVLGDGKRFRPILLHAAGELLGAPAERLDVPACAIELIHAYSLVHDDLPAMDDDELRRGRPTCHKAYDEATAILVGDALQALAFQLIAEDPRLDALPAATRLRMLAELARAASSRGMVGGQALDIEAVGRELSLAELENMHIHKTGALIRVSVRLGAFCADPVDEAHLRALDHYAKCIGLAFQIRDDILDVEGETAHIGKTRGKDAADGKPTYPALVGLEEAREMADRLLGDALDSLSPFGERADTLRALARFVVDRQR
ncbi:(2E,6E)-farnesyl diphosphate synthase [endosymbiont of unidentified scaly snail isolate Monju]|uniref:(2E,6E)-farnesyl diphosphate synthase n=1 Tax=endosymbiont of unidentified scaly snail isolate Monju TaxID=1248727 RepID=UPI00038928CC|nr:farnesyl diphosphate synthase [endosymbiont of unidentified scaly snail isolate Monju]BAN68722.1 farnesyl diphosphate synthase [endosymbiont of unidentified scaly snail isolate Monju]